MKRYVFSLFLLGAWLLSAPFVHSQIIQFSGAPAASSCPAGVLDTFAASPGAWTVGYSVRKLRAAYGGSSLQLKRTSDSTTQDVGFTGCDLDTATATSFCGTATLAVTTTTARVAVPSGTTLGVINTGTTQAYFVAGNSSVNATTAGTFVWPGQAIELTIGANTHVAGITGSGTTSFLVTNCRVQTFYDQVNSNNAVQATTAKQPFYYPACSANGRSCLAWCAACGMAAADNASYKTANVHLFAIHKFGLGTTSTGTGKMLMGYPFDATSDEYTNRWAVMNEGQPDTMSVQENASSQQFVNAEGFGAAYRGTMYQYEYSTSDWTFKYFNTDFLTTPVGAAITYPNAVGLYYGMARTGAGNTLGGAAEALLASGTQTARSSISSNQATYFGVTAPQTSVTTADGFTYTPYYIGSYHAPCCTYLTINGRQYSYESAYTNYSFLNATNVKTSGTTSLGDMWRFSVRQWDAWGNQNTNRSELGNTASGETQALDTIYYGAYAMMVETGSDVVSTIGDGGQASWNILGQNHANSASVSLIAAPFYVTLSGTKLKLTKDDVVVWTSASGLVVFGTYNQIFFKIRKSTTGTTDIFDFYVDGVQVYTCSGACFATDTGALYWKFGIYRGDIGNIVGTQFIRYGNMQLTTTDISAQIATPLDPPTQHN